MNHLFGGMVLVAALASCGKDGGDSKKEPAPSAKQEPDKPAAPIEYKGKDGFKVTAPQEPQLQTDKQPTPAGDMPLTIYKSFAAPGSPGALNIMVTDMSGAAGKFDAAALIGGAVGGGLTAMPNVSIDKQEPLMGKDPVPGMDLWYKVADPAGEKKIRARFYFHNNKLFQVQAFYEAKASDFAATASTFVESFAFTD